MSHTHTSCNVQFSGYLGLAGCALYIPFPLLECIIAGKAEALHRFVVYSKIRKLEVNLHVVILCILLSYLLAGCNTEGRPERWLHHSDGFVVVGNRRASPTEPCNDG